MKLTILEYTHDPIVVTRDELEAERHRSAHLARWWVERLRAIDALVRAEQDAAMTAWSSDMEITTKPHAKRREMSDDELRYGAFYAWKLR